MRRINSVEHPSNKRQRGVSLIETMVATLVLVILFMGLAHVLARGLVSQRYVNTQNLALLEMREALQKGICQGAHSLSLIEEIALKTDCMSRQGLTVSVGTLAPVLLAGNELPPIIDVSTPGNDRTEGLFGGDGVIKISSN